MKITVDNKEVEAYRLIMRKENALEILNGTKKVEIRDFSNHYGKMFIDKEKEKIYFEKMKQKDFQYVDENGMAECDKIYNKTNHVFFTNYNKSWSMVVRIDAIYMLYMIKNDIEFLSDELGFKEYDNEWQQFEEDANAGNMENIPSFFALTIKEVVSHEGLSKVI